MRNMSFALTTEQVRNRTKTVTRRLGWKNAKAGDVVQPVVKGQGIPKGGTVEKIGGPIRFVSVTRVRLCDISTIDVYREGFPNLTQRQFIEMFKEHNGGLRDQEVTRIEFEYIDSDTAQVAKDGASGSAPLGTPTTPCRRVSVPFLGPADGRKSHIT